MNYTEYTAADFCADSFFIQWVQSPTDESNRFWNDFIRAHTDKEEDILMARSMLHTFENPGAQISKESLLDLKRRIEVETRRLDQKTSLFTSYFRYAAAACLVAGLAAVLWLYFRPAVVEHRTGFGEMKEIRMNDGSVVTLNAHSILRIVRDGTSLRKVELDGEAFFRVARVTGSRFVVTTPEANVEVIGTEFNVNSRRQNTRVVLTKGEIALSGIKNSHPVRLRPGDMAVVTNGSGRLVPVKVNTSHHTSWMDRIMILKDTPVSEVVAGAEDSFGVKIEFAEPALLEKKLSGKLPIENAADFIENLALILDLQATDLENGYLLH